MSKLRAFFADRKRVLVTAAVLGAGFGAIALARRGGSAPEAAAAPQLVAGTASPYSFDGVDSAMVDSQNASAIVEQIGALSSGVANLEGGLSAMFDLIDQAKGAADAAAAEAAGASSAAAAAAAAATAGPPAVVAPTPTIATPSPATPKPAGTPLPRWTPPDALRIGGATDIQGASFAGRVKLTNGQFAPIVKYANGTTQIHPEWQRWMAANKVAKA